MPNAISRLIDRIYPGSAWDFGGQAVNLESPDRLSFKDGMRMHWLTVKSDGTLRGGVLIDIATMNATDPTLIDEPRDVRIKRACRVRAFLSSKGFTCEILEDGHRIHGVCVEAWDH
jgi:hypothetical protein